MVSRMRPCQFQVVGRRVASVHGRQNLIVTRLDGQVDVLADLGKGSNGVYELLAHVVGVRCEEADALYAVDGV